MTQSAFDPACFSTYPASNPPKFLHFEYEGSSDIFRYMLVDEFHVNDISPVTKRCQGEADDGGLRDKYINRPVRMVNVPVEVVPKAVEAELEELRQEVAALKAQLEPQYVGDQNDGLSPEVAGTIDPTAVEPSTKPEPNAEATAEQPEAPTDS